MSVKYDVKEVQCEENCVLALFTGKSEVELKKNANEYF
jgi:hypothetical protein